MNNPAIVIVGAGAAGITAGRWLSSRGINATILEARARLGGRAYTDTRSLGIPVDLGCAWLHSADANPWTAYAREQGFEVIVRDPIWRRRIGMVLTTAEYQKAWTAAWERNESLIAKSVQAGRDDAVSEIVPNDEFRPMWDAVMTWLMGAESERVSGLDFDRYEDTGRNWPVRDGFGALIAHAARGLDVRLDVNVTDINWSGARVAVNTSAGTVECNAVIVTVPTSVLARDGVRFTPALPSGYHEAFHGVPLGIANKVFMEVDASHLPFEGTTNFVGSDHTFRTGSYAVRPTGHDVLLAYFGGSLAEELESRGELESFSRDELKSIFGADFVTHIRRAVATAWSTDPFARGSYSVALPGKAQLRAVLNQPVGERIFFAGEANSIGHFGTANGAWESGVASAERALAATNAR
jgi:monoamine oxidase